MSTMALFVTSTLIWGSGFLAITWQLGTVAPEVSVAYRFAVVAILLAAWCSATGRSLRFSARDHAFLAALGVLLFSANFIAIYQAERYVPSGLVAVLYSTIVFMNPIGARLAFGTPLSMRVLGAGALGVAGVCLLFLPELEVARAGGDTALGVVYGLGSTLLACGGNMVAVRNHRAGLAVFEATSWSMAYGAGFAALLALLLDVRWTFDAHPAYVLSLLYLVVFGSIVAFGAYLTLLNHVGAGPAAFVFVAVPVVALALSTFFEGYRWTPVTALGAILAVAGNSLALRGTRTPRRSDG